MVFSFHKNIEITSSKTDLTTNTLFFTRSSVIFNCSSLTLSQL